jgi:hypothetical protein
VTLAVSCQLLTVEAQVYSKAVHVTFLVDSGIGTGFSWGPSVYPVIIIPAMFHIH